MSWQPIQKISTMSQNVEKIQIEKYEGSVLLLPGAGFCEYIMH